MVMSLYKEVANLIEILRHKGDIEASIMLQESVECSATGSEVLMKLRYHLSRILEDGNTYNKQIISLAKSISREIEEKLNF